jgi:hypothetical protein
VEYSLIVAQKSLIESAAHRSVTASSSLLETRRALLKTAGVAITKRRLNEAHAAKSKKKVRRKWPLTGAKRSLAFHMLTRGATDAGVIEVLRISPAALAAFKTPHVMKKIALATIGWRALDIWKAKVKERENGQAS